MNQYHKDKLNRTRKRKYARKDFVNKLQKTSEYEEATSKDKKLKQNSEIDEDYNQKASSDSLCTESLEEIKARAHARRKEAMQKPKLFLENPAPVLKQAGYKTPLFVFDLQTLIVRALKGNEASFTPRFCRLLRWSKIKQVLVIVAKGVSEDDYREHEECFPQLKAAFEMEVPMITPAQYGESVLKELFQVPLTLRKATPSEGDVDQSQDDKSSTVPEPVTFWFKEREGGSQQSKPELTRRGDSSSPEATGSPYKCDPQELLLSIEQLAKGDYPLPCFEGMYDDFVFTKDEYEKVKETSPLFAIDCEMCATRTNPMALTWVAVIDEKLNVIYSSLVKPKEGIIDYRTRYSGITEGMMLNVATGLNDVQNALRELLPPDAILCGHSINSDLLALQMFHPYLIDTAVIYNHSGNRSYKLGLKYLTKYYLGEDIQDNPCGHDPAEDATATMKLVQHKLRQGVGYGDVCIGNVPLPFGKQKEEKADDSKVGLQKSTYLRPGLDMYNSLFSITKENQKSVLFVDRETELEPYRSLVDIPCDSVRDKDSVTSACNQMTDHFMTFVQLHDFCTTSEDNQRKQKKRLSKLDKHVTKLVSAARTDCLVVVLLSGRMVLERPRDALCLLKLT